ncbi:hypothetical protein NE237_019924 [Protea cynaroides]|uniref:Uncharacterized protein n=1 Tax=Protea cynaroides TaxID=273540 RepID=A0A9Q0H6B0_9MAGN|nr:hypothetical protein NE237_019924 [Protea cynaroides]
MERRKHKVSTDDDELAVVKAAAWAWYQHGSGSEGKSVREFDLTKTHRAAGPSRYKLEAMMSINLSPSNSSNHNSLLDSYEVGRISKHLQYLIESTSDKYYGESHAIYQEHRKDKSSLENRKKKKKKKKKNSKIWNGFLFRQSAICGSKGDVVEGRVLVGSQPQRPQPHNGLVVGLEKCRS